MFTTRPKRGGMWSNGAGGRDAWVRLNAHARHAVRLAQRSYRLQRSLPVTQQAARHVRGLKASPRPQYRPTKALKPEI